MCAKNSLVRITPCLQNQEYNSIINQFEIAKCKYGVETLNITYLIKYSEVERELLYKAIHNLLEENILEKIEYTECPCCGNEQVFKNSKIKCNRCNEIYYAESIIEKFKIAKDWKEVNE